MSSHTVLPPGYRGCEWWLKADGWYDMKDRLRRKIGMARTPLTELDWLDTLLRLRHRSHRSAHQVRLTVKMAKLLKHDETLRHAMDSTMRMSGQDAARKLLLSRVDPRPPRMTLEERVTRQKVVMNRMVHRRAKEAREKHALWMRRLATAERWAAHWERKVQRYAKRLGTAPGTVPPPPTPRRASGAARGHGVAP